MELVGHRHLLQKRNGLCHHAATVHTGPSRMSFSHSLFNSNKYTVNKVGVLFGVSVVCTATKHSHQRNTKGEFASRRKSAIGATARAAAEPGTSNCIQSTLDALEPLLVRAARGEKVERPPAWMMRQAGRYMASYRKLAESFPSFRERSEQTDLIVQISLQPWKAFRPDGVIIFSDILTPLPAIGIPFEIDEVKGPILESPIRSEEGLRGLHTIELDKLHFVGESLKILRDEVGDKAAVLGFVGSPWTLATYIVEGGTTRTYTKIKTMTHQGPALLQSILSHLAQAIAEYVIFQVRAGAQCIQIFDSWGGQLTPDQWDRWSKPYIQQLVARVREACPGLPLVLYANGNGGLLERMQDTGVDVIGLDWTVDMADGRKRLGDSMAVQGNVDPAVLFAPLSAVTDAIESVVRKAGNQGHILNLGHGVLVGTPEDSVAHFFETARSLSYKEEDELSVSAATTRS